MSREARLKAWDAAEMPRVTPSLLNCDFARVGDEIAALERAGVVGLHLDVMDGHFVPNLSYGPPPIASWRKTTNLPFDAHLMVSNPAEFLDDYVQAGVDIVLFHAEVVRAPRDLIHQIRVRGCRAGLVINPPTPWTVVEPYLDLLDSVLVMSVMPGFGGQVFQPAVLEKVRAIAQARPGLNVAIDGGINASTAEQATAAGATQLVVGSATFRPDGDYARALLEISEPARKGLKQARPAQSRSI